MSSEDNEANGREEDEMDEDEELEEETEEESEEHVSEEITEREEASEHGKRETPETGEDDRLRASFTRGSRAQARGLLSIAGIPQPELSLNGRRATPSYEPAW